MKKYLVVFLLVMLVTPTLVFASWWNPFTWFKRKPKLPAENVSIQTLNSNDAQKQNITVTNTKETRPPVKSKSTPSKEIVSIQPTYTTPVLDICKNIEGLQSRAPDGMHANEGICLQINPINNEQLTQIQNSLNQIAQNTTPVVEKPTVVDNSPKEVKFEEIAKSHLPNIGADYVQISVYASKLNDVITMTMNSQIYTKTAEKDNGPSQMFEIHGLEPGTWYPYEIKVERGNLYAIKKSEFRTDFAPSN